MIKLVEIYDFLNIKIENKNKMTDTLSYWNTFFVGGLP